MDGDTFDALVQRALGNESRRGVLRAGLGAFAASALAAFGLRAAEDAEAKKHKKKGKGKKKKRKKKTSLPPLAANFCLTVGGTTICPPDRVCCDPQRSTGGGCAPLGYPVCCVSDMFAHPSGTTCCASQEFGDFGVCDDQYPHCCPPTVGGCCKAGYPVCCNDTDPVNGEPYCCLAGEICCPETESGCCTAQGIGLTAERAESGPRGTRRTASSRPSAGLPRFEPVD